LVEALARQPTKALQGGAGCLAALIIGLSTQITVFAILCFLTKRDFSLGDDGLGSGLIDQSQKQKVAAMVIADMKVWGQRS
jgi:hypothetical protein